MPEVKSMATPMPPTPHCLRKGPAQQRRSDALATARSASLSWLLVAVLSAASAVGLTSVLAPAAHAAGTAPEVGVDPAAERHMRELAAELRCLQCQNQTLADSNAPLAVDLREQIREQISQGRSDAQIKSYLVDRYGDFVLYRPPVQGNTLLLWFGPALILAAGLFALYFALKRRLARLAAEETAAGGAAAPADHE
jgi:cytochrome c-type biogenesis protein CcmH